MKLRELYRHLACRYLMVLFMLLLATGDASAGFGMLIRNTSDGRILVVGVEPGSSAERAGVKPGDIIVEYDGHPVANAEALVRLSTGNRKKGGVPFTILRDGWRKRIEIEQNSTEEASTQHIRLGVDIKDAEEATPGALIVSITPGGIAATHGLAVGDIIVSFDGHSIRAARDLASAIQSYRGSGEFDLRILRNGWKKTIHITSPPARGMTLQQLGEFVERARAAQKERSNTEAADHDRRKALVAVGDFQVKAAHANRAIGDGLREMLLTSLHQSGYFIVLERMDLAGLVAEQTLAHKGTTAAENQAQAGRMEIADIIIYGVVSEFQPEAGGISFSNPLAGTAMGVSQSSKYAEMTIDIRAVDSRTGRVLAAKAIPGVAQQYSGTMAGSITAGNLTVPIALKAYRKTPMEAAIRNCIRRATYFLVNNIPRRYFRHL